MTPATTSRPCISDHSYELPLRRNLLLLLDLLDVLRFMTGVLLDRLGVAPCHDDVVRLPGQLPWDGELLDAERFLEAALRAPATIGTRPVTGLRYRRRRPAQLLADDDMGAAEEDDEDEAAVCAICLARLDAGGCQQVAELCGCSHAFHAACIDAWVSSDEAVATCPLCRAPVSPAAVDGPCRAYAR